MRGLRQVIAVGPRANSPRSWPKRHGIRPSPPKPWRCPLARTGSPTEHPRTFGHPVFFDLTTLRPPPPEVPTVYYLVPEAPTRDRPTTWRTVLGFGAVISGGLSLGLLLVFFLL